jgi:hypothetical protein
MRYWMRLVLVGGLLAAGIAAGWGYRNRQGLDRQWASYRVGTATDVDEARTRLAWFESGPDADDKLHDLVRRWGTGNQSFDFYLAWYVHDRQSSERFRETFSLELAKRPDLLARWAHFWLWRVTEEPDRQICQTVAYLANVAKADASKTLTWREVLDLEAIFHQAGHDPLAERLSPTNWRERYLRWVEVSSGQVAHVDRPETPFADWVGAVPAKSRR